MPIRLVSVACVLWSCACVSTPPPPEPAPVAFAPPTTCRRSPAFVRSLGEWVAANRLEFQRCFDDVFPKAPQPKGTMELAFTVQPDGGVTDVAIANDTVPDPRVAGCVKGKVERWHLPTCPEKALGAVFPLGFGPK